MCFFIRLGLCNGGTKLLRDLPDTHTIEFIFNVIKRKQTVFGITVSVVNENKTVAEIKEIRSNRSHYGSNDLRSLSKYNSQFFWLLESITLMNECMKLFEISLIYKIYFNLVVLLFALINCRCRWFLLLGLRVISILLNLI